MLSPTFDLEPLLDSLSDGLVLVAPDWRVLFMNRTAESLLGTSRRDFVGRGIGEGPVAPSPERMAVYREVMETRRTRVLERVDLAVPERGRRLFQGEVHPLAPEGIAILFRDITDEEILREEARSLAEDLRERSAHLEAQAVELEMLNEELRASEARLRAVIDSSLDAVVTTDAQSVILDWTPQAEAVFGWPAEEAIGRTLNDTIIPPGYREAHAEGVRLYLETGEGPILNRRVEVPALHRDGHEIPVELTVAAAHWGQEVVFSAFLRDLTEEKAEERLRSAQHAVTRALADSATLEEAQPRILQALGEALEWDAASLWGVDPADRVLRLQEFWHAPALDAGEFEAASRDAALAPGEGLPGRVWTAKEPAWVVDVARDPNFPRAEVAKAAGLRSGLAFPILLGSGVLGVIELFSRASRRPEEVLLRTLGSIGSSQIGQFMERKRAQAEVRRLNQDLQRRLDELAEATRAKDRFLATMSHELRTPLNAILGYTELLDAGISGEVTEAQRAQLERIRSSGQHLLDLINDVLDVVRAEAGALRVEVQPVGLATVIREAINLVLPQAEAKGLELTVEELPEELPRVMADPRRLRQMLVNLLSNAVKFTERGTVALEGGPGDDGMVHLSVRDTGIGIAPEKLKGLFTDFFQADGDLTRRHGGSGLGLAISRRLARLMGGDVTVESAPDRGSVFTIRLPAAAGEPEPASWAPEEWAVEGERLEDLARVGKVLLDRADEISRAVAERLQGDPATPRAGGVDPVLLEDHYPTFLADLGQSLVLLAEGGGKPALLRDGSEIQRLIAQLHGAQRCGLQWTEDALRREFQVLCEEVEAVVDREAPGVAARGAGEVRELVRRLIRHAEHVSLRGFRTAVAGD